MKTVCIVGGNKGIGFATAKQFLNKGCRVLIAGRNYERVMSAAEKLGENAGGVVWDVSDVSTAKSAVEQANSIFGDICVYVNNAGILCNDDVGENAVDFFGKTEKGWDDTMDVNLKGLYFAIQAQATYMRDNKIEGNIVNVCSEMAFRPAVNSYCISKWGVRGMTEGLGKLLASYGIVLNGIAPGETATEILRQKEGIVKNIDSPRGVQAMPEEIADAIYFLANSRNIIGELLISDGGRHLN